MITVITVLKLIYRWKSIKRNKKIIKKKKQTNKLDLIKIIVT